MSFDQLLYIAPIVIVITFVVLVAREFACWYFKVNQRIQIQEEVLEELKAMRALQQQLLTKVNGTESSSQDKVNHEEVETNVQPSVNKQNGRGALQEGNASSDLIPMFATRE
ncbi:hypothetical protein [Thalassotalea sp. Y01]|uniref:hypothetical protein n=1 Tax=Thalassotalea sp. Y01 TaxID=2729613 RepID=UPI00145E0AD1|nr:hypothetical protein [Thalassotalea sp. Y01]NMP15179.1 hypothetical protein [Thalassotalea sp. Y01]